MKEGDSFSFTGRLRSIDFASTGILLMLKTQHNAWVHLAATIGVVLAGLYYGVTGIEWGLLILAVVLVWMAEALNTAFEFLCDVTNPEFHPIVQKAKDVSAGAVLICAVGAVIVGLVIFIPYVNH